MVEFEQWLSAWTFGSVVVRLALACVVGAVIGMNREMHSKGAGVKTHVLVCLGSAVAMMVSQYVSVMFPDVNADMNRIGASVVSGVGFLGVGTIIVTGRNEVKGLTTAAGLWASACIGLAVGIGAAVLSVLSLVAVLFTFVVLSRLDARIRNVSRSMDVEIELVSAQNVKNLFSWLDDRSVTISGMAFPDDDSPYERFRVVLNLTVPDGVDKMDLLKQMNTLRYVDFCAES